MCLYVDSARLIAKENITVYKVLEKISILTTDDSIPFTGIISNKEVTGIAVNKTSADVSDHHRRLFFLTNDPDLNGSKCKGLYLTKYAFSWVLDHRVSKDILNSLPLIDIYITPYQKQKVEIGQIVTSHLQTPDQRNAIEIGIHSFGTLEGCKHFKDYLSVIVRCIIPKGSEYYIGMFGGEISYASTVLIYEEII